jgi:hypothetical protein
MAQADGHAADAATPATRCFRCGAAVEGSVHTRSGYIVGHYVLHTGRTVEATLRRGEDEAPLVYSRLVEPATVVACRTCFELPDVRRLWLAFGDAETDAA